LTTGIHLLAAMPFQHVAVGRLLVADKSMTKVMSQRVCLPRVPWTDEIISSTMRTWRLVLSAIALVALLSLGACLLATYARRNSGRSAAEKLKRDIDLNLPIGSSREQVRTWFRAHSIIPQELFDDSTGRPVGLGATVYHHSVFGDGLIAIYFYFDESGGLEKSEVRYDRFSL
jgi:hypothetical protein